MNGCRRLSGWRLLASGSLFGLAALLGQPAARAQAPAPQPGAQEESEEELQQRIDQLERRVNDLESTTVLSEPETRVKRIEVYVDENGVEYETPQPGTRP